MKTEEKRSDKGRFERKFFETSCLGGQGFAETAGQCCTNAGGGFDCRSMMRECMRGCRWLPLVPVVLGILLLLLGYYLDAEITRILWMGAAGFVILMGTFCLLMMSRMNKTWRSAE
jgi:hypothetical protein